MSGGFLRHPALAVDHGFGTRGASEPAACLRPRQVHGNTVVTVAADTRAPLGEADAVVSTTAGQVLGVVTADCVPILVAQPGAAAAIHAGWRGLARGVIGAALSALDRTAGPSAERVAVIGPHICAHHYEVDAPVREALASDFGGALEAAFAPTRPGHWALDLGALARDALQRGGLSPHRAVALPDSCTFRDAARFASRRRDGPGGERLVHWIRVDTPHRDAPGTGETAGRS